MTQVPNATSPINTRNGLVGRVVNIGVALDAQPEFIHFGVDSNNRTVVKGGLMVLLQNVLAARGGFSVNYKVVGNVSRYKSTNDYLVNALSVGKIDIFGGAPVAVGTNGVVGSNLDYTRELVDMSVVLISPAYVSSGYSIINVWGFMAPLDTSVWLLLVGRYGFMKSSIGLLFFSSIVCHIHAVCFFGA
jgi:hypothetical protein